MGVKVNTTSKTARTLSENVTSIFLSTSKSPYACKMWSNYSGNSTGTSDLEVRKVNKIDCLSSHAHVVHTAAKHAIWRQRKNKKVCEMSKKEKCTCKACKTIVFLCQICKFVTFLLRFNSLFPQWWLFCNYCCLLAFYLLKKFH